MDLNIQVVKKSSTVISCQSAVKLNLQKLLKLTHLSPSTLNKALLNLLLKLSLPKKFNLRPQTNYLEFDFLHQLKFGTHFDFEPLNILYPKQIIFSLLLINLD